MIPHTEILNSIKELEITEIRTNKKITYLNIPSAFDIETTSTIEQGVKVAFMYVWQFGIGHDNGVYYGRTWAELLEMLETLSDALGLAEDRRLVVYVHNLGYEFQFVRKYFEWLDIFAIAERKPLKALCTLGIEFRCSYLLSGFSLANTAKNLVTHKIKKLDEDFNYSLVRHHETPLTPEEIEYCINDIKIVTAYISEQIELYSDISKIPMTNTGRVRTFVRNKCYFSNTNHRKSSKGKYLKYRQIMQDLTLDGETYVQLKRAFMGGFTHANAKHSGKVLENVTSIDFTSSYPAVMVSEKFPMSRFKPIKVKSLKHLEELCSIHAVVFEAKFINIKPKIEQENYLSESKCNSTKGASINNGRIYSADEITTTITNVDYEIMNQCYEWDKLEVANVKFAYQNYLPKSIIESILELYQDKTVLKDVEGSEVEYMLSKGMLNSIYGMSVTDIVKDNAVYGDEWETEKVHIGEEIDKYNDSKTRFLYYAWGLWVTAYARRNLWTGIIAVGEDYVYSDTDSMKLLNYEKHKKYIEWFDGQIVDKMNEMSDYFKFDKELLHPKTKEGIVKTLGIWDYEGTYTRFKTLGAKRYLIEDRGRLQITVAGLSKQNGIDYMIEKCNNDHSKVFKMFDNELYVPADRTGKMTHTYIDDELQIQLVDYLGNKADIKTVSGIHLENCDFTLSISLQYNKFMQDLASGYIFKKVDYI